jgi:hypothetical protein
MNMSAEVFLSPVSFIFILKKLGMNFEVKEENNLFLLLWLPNGKQQLFLIFAEDRNINNNCGYIQTNKKILSELFGENIMKVMDTCEKKLDETGKHALHCSISKYPFDERNNAKSVINGKIFNCRF